MPQERMIRCWWLRFEDVKCSSSHNAFVNSLYKCHFVNYTTTSTVDNAHAFFHNLELRTGDHVARLWRKWCMHRHEVSMLDDFIHTC
ncbi:hypothetical protein D1872_294940 [compost metagenome]